MKANKKNRVDRFIGGCLTTVAILIIISLCLLNPIKISKALIIHFDGTTVQGEVINYNIVEKNNKGNTTYSYYPIIEYYVGGEKFESTPIIYQAQNADYLGPIEIAYYNKNPMNIMVKGSLKFEIIVLIWEFMLIVIFFWLRKINIKRLNKI